MFFFVSHRFGMRLCVECVKFKSTMLGCCWMVFGMSIDNLPVCIYTHICIKYGERVERLGGRGINVIVER